MPATAKPTDRAPQPGAHASPSHPPAPVQDDPAAALAAFLAPLDDDARAAVLNLAVRAWAEDVLRADAADMAELSATGPRLSWMPAYGRHDSPTASVACSLTGRTFTLPARMPVPIVLYSAAMSDGSTWKTHG